MEWWQRLWFERGGSRETAEGVVGDRVKGGVAARYHCGTAKVEAIPRIPPLRSFSLPISLFPDPRRYDPSRSFRHPATLATLLCLSSSLASWYVRTIANGLQPLPGIYPRNLPERPSNSAASSRVRAHPTYPSGSLEGIYRLRAL